MARLFLFISFWGILAVTAQDSSKPALPPAPISLSDSAAMTTPNSPPVEETTKIDGTKAGAARPAWKEWFSIEIDPISALITLASLIFVGYFARKSRLAELRVEEEWKKRTDLEDRQRKLEEQLALLSASRQFDEKWEEQKRTKQAQTAEERYRQILKDEVCQIQLAAPGAGSMAVDLSDTFVNLNLVEHDRMEGNPRWGAPDRMAKNHEGLSPDKVIARAFKENRYKALLIVGDPGSGKTTLLSFFAMCGLQPEGHLRLGFSRPILPLYLPLREVDPTKSFGENLWQWAGKYDSHIRSEEFDGWLQNRDTLVLLDGLDEVNILENRKKVCAWIGHKSAGLHRARFVITSRGTALRSDDNLPLPASLLRAEVCDFSHDQKCEFLRKWFPAAYLKSSQPKEHETREAWENRRRREAQNTAEEVIAYLEQPENRSLRELAGIPMLLQLLALIWKLYQAKPESRAKLYDVALDYLLEYRDDQRGLTPVLKAEKARRVLGPAALWMQEEIGVEEVPKDRLHDYIKPILEPIDHTVKPEKLCENLRDRAGLIADYGKNQYIFRHKSFREYFAGLQLAADYQEKNRLALLVKTFGDATWAEPLFYFMSKADGKAFTTFMKAFFDSPKSHELSQEQQNLLQALVREASGRQTEAFEACLHDPAKNDAQRRYALDCLKIIGGERIKAILQSFVTEGVGSDGIRDYAAEIAAQLEKPSIKPAMRAAGPAVFQQLPPSFRNPLEYNAEYILIRGGTIQYSATKQIEKVPDIYFAKYPVTNKQYRRFIRYLRDEETEIGKFVSPKIFAEKLLEFVANDKAYADYLGQPVEAWPDKLKSEYDENRKFNSDDQPVVGVSWYASRAYCFWLSVLETANHDLVLLDTPAQKLAGIFRLPQEVEWERAAAGRKEDGPPRKYPWPAEKGEPNEKLANYGGNVGQTTPVGRYPEGATPEGLMDMAGNVWEWQENWYDKDKDARALRGGSWIYDSDILPCAIRIRVIPQLRINFVGFRVVRAQSFFDTL